LNVRSEAGWTLHPLEPLLHPCGARFRLFKPLSRASTILFLGLRLVCLLTDGWDSQRGPGRVAILNVRPEAVGYSTP